MCCACIIGPSAGGRALHVLHCPTRGPSQQRHPRGWGHCRTRNLGGVLAMFRAARGVPAMRNTMRYTPCDGNWPWQLDARKARRGESQLDKRFGSGFWPSQFLQVQAMGAIELSNSRLLAGLKYDPGRSKRARWAASSPLRRCGASSPSCCAALKFTGG